MVFQNYALYPHMTVQKNLAFGLRQRKVPADQVRTRVAEVSRMLGLDELLQRRPAQLSGGQRQRVAMGRALARDPKAFLLDEPLSNLDAKLRMQLRAELKKLHQTVGTTAIYVTHDQVEAMTLGDRIAVMSDGVLQQLGPPQEVYSRPANLFVAGFIGSPPMNLLAGTAQGGEVRFGPFSFTRPGVPDGEVVIGLRPEALAPAGGEGVQVELTVEIVEPLGNEVVVHGTVPGRNAGPPAVDAVEGRAHVIARLGAATRLTPGELVRLAFDPAGAHLFDPADGLRIDR
jgi:ABC-type sugar transport system ATPase subunit